MTATEGKRTALVTGASSGIGRALAELLAADGFDLVLVARQEGHLRDLAEAVARAHGTRALVLAVDLSAADAPRVIDDRVSREDLQIDVLVNNAGFGNLGAFVERPLSVYLAMIQVNITSLTALTRLFLPGMIARRRGRILNVSSTAAFQPGPFMAVYYATKAYVQSFTEALAAEIEGSGVTVTAFAPGPTRSGFQEAAGFGSAAVFRSPWVPDAMSVARVGYRAMMRGRRTVVPGVANRIGAQAYRFLPRRWLTAIIGRLQRSRG